MWRGVGACQATPPARLNEGVGNREFTCPQIQAVASDLGFASSEGGLRAAGLPPVPCQWLQKVGREGSWAPKQGHTGLTVHTRGLLELAMPSMHVSLLPLIGPKTGLRQNGEAHPKASLNFP